MAERVAVVCAREGHGGGARAGDREGGLGREAVAEYLDACGIADAKWFAPRDVDDVDAAVGRGEVSRVVFDTPETFLAAVWDRRIDYAAWRARGVEAEFAGLEADAAGAVNEAAWAWVAWDRRRRRARVVGGVVLSAIALAAGFCVLWASIE